MLLQLPARNKEEFGAVSINEEGRAEILRALGIIRPRFDSPP